MRRSLFSFSALTLALTLAVAACGNAPAPSATPTPMPMPIPTTFAAPVSGSPSTASPGSSTPATFAYVPLWPFESVAAAKQWQREAGAGGHQPWRLDAGEVAVAFAKQYLGFSEIDHVVRATVTATDARVTVGWTADGVTGPAAVIHLVRFGSGDNQPWEVVGTDDPADFSLTRPQYGSTVTDTITVGGRISGVDESIRVTARQLSGIVGRYCCLPAGAPAPWSVQLHLTGTRPGPVTIVASTGGHAAAVERFVITGVRSPG